MEFIDKHSDLDTVNYLSKSVGVEILEKALDRTGLVQKEVQVRTKYGVKTRKQWVKAAEDQPTPRVKSTKAPDETKQKQKRPVVEATPFTITDTIKHLVSIKDMTEVPEHVKALAIPPAWRNVMVSPDPHAEVLAVGKDEQNRPHYLYSQEHWDKAHKQKFQRVQDLIKNSNKVYQAISEIEDKDTSDCLKLIFHMGIRPGSTRDTKSKVEALGATTLRGENVVVDSGKVYLKFVGKEGVSHEHIVPNDELAAMLLDRKEKAGDTGDLFNTTDVKLRDALKPLKIHPKDLRTMLANKTAASILVDIPPVTEPKAFAKVRNQVGDVVCGLLGNKREMSLGSYIDPEVFRSWSEKGMTAWEQTLKQSKKEDS